MPSALAGREGQLQAALRISSSKYGLQQLGWPQWMMGRAVVGSHGASSACRWVWLTHLTLRLTCHAVSSVKGEEYTHCLIHKLPRPGFFRVQEVSICYRIERPTKWLNGVWPAFSFFNRKHQSIWHVHKRFWFMNLPFLCICEFTYFVYHMLHLHVRSLRARAFVLTSSLFTTVVCWE